MMQQQIDFVIPWVDGKDPAWRSKKNSYWAQTNGVKWQDGNNNARFRDWDNLHYWFRAAEKFAPWVRRIFFVTCGQIPEWLNCDNPKLIVVNHEDYIPNNCLPVFNANPIEINFHRIPDLSEQFVYFNDDMFLTNYVTPNDFFIDGKPREMAIMYPIVNNGKNDTFNHMLLTMTGVINDCFNKKECIKKNFFKWFHPRYGKFLINNILMYRFNAISGLIIPHVPSPLKKSTMEEIWDRFPEKMMEVTSHKFRSPADITQYIFRYWEIMGGNFIPTNIFKYSSEFFLSDNEVEIEKVEHAILCQKYKMICINDSTELSDFEWVRDRINRCFEMVLPQKSSFEK